MKLTLSNIKELKRKSDMRTFGSDSESICTVCGCGRGSAIGILHSVTGQRRAKTGFAVCFGGSAAAIYRCI